MLKTFLPVDLSENSEISQIYTKLAEKIHLEMPNIIVIHNGVQTDLDTREKVKSFLLSKDFYSYHFVGKNDFWSELAHLPARCKIKNLLSKDATCDSIDKFHRKYPRDEHSKNYSRLIPFPEFSIFELKEKSENFPEFKFKNSIEKTFSYSKLGKDDRHTILVSMNVPVCPYCNMNYTIDFLDHDKMKSTADIDHFYLKSEYPEYSLCLYNFVPSCHICNSRLKKTHSVDHENYIFPHEDSFENKANFVANNIVQYLLGVETVPTLTLEIRSGNKAVENSADLFQIEERYQQFANYSKDLIDKYRYYSELYIAELENDFASLFSKNTVKQLVFGSFKTEEEFYRESLGKLNRDLLLQLGIFDNLK